MRSIPSSDDYHPLTLRDDLPPPDTLAEIEHEEMVAGAATLILRAWLFSVPAAGHA